MSTASNEEIGEIIGGMIAWDHALQNSLTDSHLDEAIDWAKRFRDFYDEVERHNRDTYVQEILWDYAGWRDGVPSKIEHYENMKMSGRN